MEYHIRILYIDVSMLFERIRIFRFDAVRWICRGGGRVGGLGATGYRYPLGSMVLLIR